MSLITRKKRTMSDVLISPKVIIFASALAGTVGSTTSAFAEEATGHIDVYVDNSGLKDAISKAESVGVNVVRDESVVLTGDADATEANTATATKYYKTKAEELNKVADKYVKDMANYNSEVAKNEYNAAQANARMSALKTNAASNGQTVVAKSKQYVSAADVDADVKAIEAKIAVGDKLVDIRSAIDGHNIAQNAMTSYQTQADQGNIKVVRETVRISNPADVATYTQKVTTQYAELQKYVNGLASQTGTIPDDQKPTYKLYDLVVDDAILTEATAPITIFNYTAIPVTKPVTPSVSYHFYDVRSTPSIASEAQNKDGEKIIEVDKESEGGKKVVQAMVNQTIAMETDNQPLPSGRFDKIHQLSTAVVLPEGVTVDTEMSKSTEDFIFAYDEATRTASYSATAKYLVKVNANQNVNNGTVGGTVGGQWSYDVPKIYFKLDKDDTTYQVHAETIVNHEYYVIGDTITIRTDSANPEKENTNSKYVNIDNKAVLPGSINNYRLTWDFDQYKGVNIDRGMQGAGLHLIDDYPEEAVDLTGPIRIETESGEVLYIAKVDGATSGSFTKADGSAVDGVTFAIKDAADAPESLKDKIKGSFLDVAVTGYDNEFYKKYVEGGQKLRVVIPMTTKKIDNTPDKQGGTYNGNSYTNIAYQSDFGNDYVTNKVTNTVPLLDPRKDAVLSFANLTSLDIKANPTSEIEHRSIFNYRLSGSKLPTNLSEDSFTYVLTDELPEADEYNGEYIMETGNDIHFKEGTALYNRHKATGGVLKANSDITRYTTQTIARNVSRTLNTSTQTVDGADTRVTRVQFTFDEDFINSIDFTKTSWQVDAFLQAKRIKNVDGVVNIFNEVINGIDFGSTEVTTNTKANALDELDAKLKELTGRVDANDKNDAEFKEQVISALSVVIKTVQDNKAETDKAISTVANTVAENAKVTENVATEVANNKAEIKNVKVSVASLISRLAGVETKVEDNSNKIAENAKAVKQTIATLTIYAPEVVTDADALAYATNRGVAAGSIKSITLNEDNKFVVTYNTAKDSINASTPATNKPVNSEKVATKTVKIDFYNTSDVNDMYAKLKALGYEKSQIISKSGENGKFTVVVSKEVSKVEVPAENKVEVPAETKLELPKSVVTKVVASAEDKSSQE